MDELDEPLKGFQMQFYICSSIVGVILSVNYSNYVCFSAMNPMLILACGKNIGLKVLLSGTDMCKRILMTVCLSYMACMNNVLLHLWFSSSY